MTTFLGDINCKLDAKGRFLFPSAMRKQLGGEDCVPRFVVKKSIFKQCLELYPVGEWEELVAKIRKKLNVFNKQHNAFLTQFHRGIAEVSLDGNGRLLLPKKLLEQAGMSKEIVLSGIGGIVEIWDSEEYNSVGLSDEEFEAMAEDVLGADFSLEG